MRHLITIFILCVLFAFGIRPGFGAVSAQAETPVEAPVTTDNPYVDVTTAGDQLITTAVNFVFGTISTLGAAGLVTVLTAITKRLPFFQNTSAGTIGFAWGVLITVAASAAAYFGFQIQFKHGLDIIIASLPGIMMLLGIPVAASYYHEQAARLPGGTSNYIGYKRTPELATIEAIPGEILTTIQPVVTNVAAPLDEMRLRQAISEEMDAKLEAFLKRAGLPEFNWTPKDEPTVYG